MITVYGFSRERLVMRKTCMFEIVLSEVDGVVNIQYDADALAGDFCLHRDQIPTTPLQSEPRISIMKRDDMFFKNLESLESTLTVATFGEDGILGDWLVTRDDLYSSSANFRDFFMLSSDRIVEKTNATVIFRVKNYDMVGPADFHEHISLKDKQKEGYGKPWFEI